MRKIKSFSLGKVLLYYRPRSDLPGIRKQVLYDCASFACLFNFKKILSFFPSVPDRFVPGRRILSLADNYIKVIVFQVKRLAGTLDAVPYYGYNFIFLKLHGPLRVGIQPWLPRFQSRLQN